MKRGIFYCYFLAATLVCSAQQEVLEIRGNSIEIGILVDGLKNLKYGAVEGSPYLNSEFIPAKINDIKKTQFIRFNIVDQLIEVKIKANKIVMLDLKNDYHIQLLDGSNKQYSTAMYFVDGKKIKSFFEIVKTAENYVLYKQERKGYMKEQKAEGYQDKLPARFVEQEHRYYISDFKSDAANLKELPKKRRKLVAFFNKEEKLIDRFIKQERLNFNEEGDLIKILDFVFVEGQQM